MHFISSMCTRNNHETSRVDLNKISEQSSAHTALHNQGENNKADPTIPTVGETGMG